MVLIQHKHSFHDKGKSSHLQSYVKKAVLKIS